VHREWRGEGCWWYFCIDSSIRANENTQLREIPDPITGAPKPIWKERVRTKSILVVITINFEWRLNSMAVICKNVSDFDSGFNERIMRYPANSTNSE
jgi:hypothetical protein